MKKALLLLLLVLTAVLVFSSAALGDAKLTKISISNFSEPTVYQTTGAQAKQAFAASEVTMYFDDGLSTGNGIFPDLVSIRGLGDNDYFGDKSYEITLMLDSIGGTSYGSSTNLTINGKNYKAKLRESALGFLEVIFTYTPKGGSTEITGFNITGFKIPEAGMTVKDCLKNVKVDPPCKIGTIYSTGEKCVYMYLKDERGRETQIYDSYVFQGGETVKLMLSISNDGIKYKENSSGNAILDVYLNGKYRSDAEVFGGASSYSYPTAHLYFTVPANTAKVDSIRVNGLILPEAGMTVAQCKKNITVEAPCVLYAVSFDISNGIAYTGTADDYVFKAGQKVHIIVAIEQDGITYDVSPAGDAMLTPYLNGKVWSGATVNGGSKQPGDGLPTINFDYTVPEKAGSGGYSDVKSSDWFYNSVEKASAMDLVNGFNDGSFRPNANLTYAQTIKLAACMNQLYNQGSVTLTNGSPNWYDSYIDYCVAGGIISREFAATVRQKANDNIDRQTYVDIFAHSLPDAALSGRNSIPDNSLPDVKSGSKYYSSIYKLYRAGVLNGNDARGTFAPDKAITRAEVAAIVVRMMDSSERKNAPSALGQ